MCPSKSNSPCVSWAPHRISHCLWTSTPRRLTFSMAGSGRMWRCLVRCCPHYQDSAQHRNNLSRCTKGSKNREKARIRVAKMHQRVADTRTDFLQKLSTQLIHENQVIVVETLGTKNMLKNRRLARVISDAGFGDFIGMLEYKCKWYGRTLVKVDTFFPSSKLCCICHVKNVELKLQDRWECPNCQTDHQRDENAVVNLFVEGLRILAEGRSVLVCGDTVRLVTPAVKYVPRSRRCLVLIASWAFSVLLVF